MGRPSGAARGRYNRLLCGWAQRPLEMERHRYDKACLACRAKPPGHLDTNNIIGLLRPVHDAERLLGKNRLYSKLSVASGFVEFIIFEGEGIQLCALLLRVIFQTIHSPKSQSLSQDVSGGGCFYFQKRGIIPPVRVMY